MVEQIIMRSGSNTLNGFNFDHIVPASGTDFPNRSEVASNSCWNLSTRRMKSGYFITQQTFFISAQSREEYEERSADNQESAY